MTDIQSSGFMAGEHWQLSVFGREMVKPYNPYTPHEQYDSWKEWNEGFFAGCLVVKEEREVNG